DFVELYNPGALPVDIGGMYVSDAPEGSPKRSQIRPLSFVPANSYLALIADGKKNSGADHLDFKLSALQGQIALFDSDLNLVDCIFYGPQVTDVSEGRQPNGASTFAFFDQPTPGAANPGSAGNCTITTTSIN